MSLSRRSPETTPPRRGSPPPGGPPSPTPSTPGRTRDRTVLPFGPEPLQTRTIRREEPCGAVATGVYRVWDAREAARCRLCPEGLCTLEEVPGTPFATCLMLVRGEPLPGVPPAVVAVDG